jgi:hypothetical protein
MEAKIRAELREILESRGLASHMNDTKWRELCAGIDELQFPPAFQRKTLFEDEPYPSNIPLATTYWGDWGKTYEGELGIWIEWIKVAPQYKRHIGMLVSPAIEDCSNELRELLIRVRVPYVEEDGFFKIYGHAAGVQFDNA